MNQVKQPLESLKNYHDRYGCGHSKPEFTFTAQPQGFTAVCSYKGKSTNATCRTKKEAQRKAASEMLAKLKLSISVSNTITTDSNNFTSGILEKPTSEVTNFNSHHFVKKLTESQESKASTFIEMFQKIEGFQKVTTAQTDVEILSDVNIGFKRQNAPKSTLLQQYKNSYSDAVDHFQAIMKEMGLHFFCEVPEIKQEFDTYVVILSIAFNGIVTAGSASTLAEAVYEACENMINTLLILTA